ncbi:inositol hydrolase, partial [Klebsiella pneumoniae]
MGKLRLTKRARRVVKFLDNQYLEVDGVELKFVKGIFA